MNSRTKILLIVAGVLLLAAVGVFTYGKVTGKITGFADTTYGNVSGTATGETSGMPIKSGIVIIRFNNPQSQWEKRATLNTYGQYAITGVPYSNSSQQFNISVWANFSGNSVSKTFTFDQTNKTVNFDKVPDVPWIKGRVTVGGQPASGKRITLYEISQYGSSLSVKNDTTDSQGYYILYAVKYNQNYQVVANITSPTDFISSNKFQVTASPGVIKDLSR